VGDDPSLASLTVTVALLASVASVVLAALAWMRPPRVPPLAIGVALSSCGVLLSLVIGWAGLVPVAAGAAALAASRRPPR
jgi:hypothetical protein